jgi:hypothetical protein
MGGRSGAITRPSRCSLAALLAADLVRKLERERVVGWRSGRGIRWFPFRFPFTPRDDGNRNRESAREHVAGAVFTDPAIDEGGERRLQRRVPDLAELSEGARRERRGRGGEVLFDALGDRGLARYGKDRLSGARAEVARGERDGVTGGGEVQRHRADRGGGAVLDRQRELVAQAAEVEVRVATCSSHRDEFC